MAGETTLSGRAVRDEAGFRTENLRLANPQLSFASNGQISSTQDRHRLRGRAQRSRAPRPARQRAGSPPSGRATGEGRPIARRPLGRASPRASSWAAASPAPGSASTARSTAADVTGALSGDGALDGLVMRLAADLAVAGESRALSGLDVAVGPNRLTGELSQTGTAPVDGPAHARRPRHRPARRAGAGGRHAARSTPTSRSAPRDPGQGVALHRQRQGSRRRREPDRRARRPGHASPTPSGCR